MYHYASSSSIPLSHVDVLPAIASSQRRDADDDSHDGDYHRRPTFLAASIKLHLLKLSYEHRHPRGLVWQCKLNSKSDEEELDKSLFRQGKLLSRQRATSETTISSQRSDNDYSYDDDLLLPQNDVTLPAFWPCQCRGYVLKDSLPAGAAEAPAADDDDNKDDETASLLAVRVTETTTIRVLTTTASSIGGNAFTITETSDIPTMRQGDLVEQVLMNQNPETIKELSLRMKMIWARKVKIGNTPHALRRMKQQEERRRQFGNLFKNKKNAASRQSTDDDDHLMTAHDWAEAALIVHSPHHGAGKSLLVQCLARQLEPRARVYVIRSASLLAQYGIAADAVLESTLHELVYGAGVLQGRPVCLVLDDLDALLSPASTSTAYSGDAAIPVLNAMTTHLRVLTRSLQEGVFPFPIKNPLYNVCAAALPQHGWVAPVRLCFVGIMTCADDGGRGALSGSGIGHDDSSSMSLFDYLVAGRYRLPTLTASTRLTAFCAALRRAGVSLDSDAEQGLARLAASATWAYGPAFERTAQQLPVGIECSREDLQKAFARVGRTMSSSKASVSFESPANTGGGSSDDLFDSVGGNTEAKLALREALALEPTRRALLASFGLLPPAGVLLYGPPGCGKTLLAKAIARALQSQNASSAIGGAFVSLSSSDIVHAEVGTGEKLLVSAFETARMNTPSVIFIDEFQALFTDRSSGGSSRFSTTLLSLLDDIRRWEVADQKVDSTEGTSSSMLATRIVVLAATNTPWMVDKAFLRPGRFDHVVHVGLPDLQDRQSIFCLLIEKMKTSFANVDSFSQILAQRTQGYSGADIATVCRTAAVNALVGNDAWVGEAHFLAALDQVKPSSSQELVAKISKWKS